DFLDLKLGMRKPRCGELLYRPPSEAERAGAAKIRRMVKENFGLAIERPGENLFAFVKDLSEVHYLPASDPAERATADEVDLSQGWSISADATLEAAARRFAAYLRSAMSAHVAVGQSKKNIRLQITSGLDGGREAFRIQVNQDAIHVNGHDEA